MTLTVSAAASRGWLFGEPDFRRLWLVGLLVFSVRWLEMLAVAVFAYQRTGSPLVVALLTMLRMLLMALFGALIGAAAERVERRSALVLVVASMLLCSIALAVLAWSDALEVWHLALASFINGVTWTTDNPVRRTMIGEVVGPDRMSAAMSIDVGANNASRMLGPTIGGILFATLGIGGAFSVSVVGYLIAVIVALHVSYRSAAAPSTGLGVLGRMIEGLVLIRRDPRLSGTMVITMIYNTFGWPFTSMIPVIGQDNLGLGAAGIGLLASLDGVGAFCGAIVIALCARPPHFARLYIGGVAVYLLMLPVFALAPDPLLAGSVLLLTGLANSGFSIMQATLVYLAAPPEMRSRVFGVLCVCIGVGMIGFLHLGWLAGMIGATWAIVTMGGEGLVAMLLTRRLWRAVGP
ncbi:MAG: MFS transporter [Alphaproteobacteria bacterium]|nr:MFS transporter [Alphaproteobacteria bacterium]